MGRVLSMGAMMGSMLKLEETITLKVEGDGPIGKIIVDSDAHGNIRGYCDNPHCHFEYNDFRLNAKQTIGTTGFISVIKDLKLKMNLLSAQHRLLAVKLLKTLHTIFKLVNKYPLQSALVF